MSDMQEVSPQPESAALAFSAIQSQFRFLEGKVLTVVDATFSDVAQRKAVKDLMRGHFRDQLKWVSYLCHSSTGVCLEAAGENTLPE